MNALGLHLLLDLQNCDTDLIDDIDYIEETMVRAASRAGATVIGRTFHKFDPRGVTGVVTISESHICIHTWPEHAYAAVDIFTCGTKFKPKKAVQIIVGRFRCKQSSVTEIKRGHLSEIASTVA